MEHENERQGSRFSSVPSVGNEEEQFANNLRERNKSETTGDPNTGLASSIHLYCPIPALEEREQMQTTEKKSKTKNPK